MMTDNFLSGTNAPQLAAGFLYFRSGPGRNEEAIHDTRRANYSVWTEQDAHDAWSEMWRFTADRYGDSPVVVGFNLVVEPHVNTLIDPRGRLEPIDVQTEAEGTLMDWNAFAADMTAAIRQVDPDTPIIVNSLHWGSAEWFAALRPTGDARTVYSFHAYEPDIYTHQDEGEIEISYPSTVQDRRETIEFDRNWIEEEFQPVIEFEQKYGVPIFVGESGSMRWVPGAVEFHSDLTAIFEAHGWNHVYYVWRTDDNGWDGFNLERGTDPANHSTIPDNPLLAVYLDRWAQNAYYPPVP
jgi:hypothetical protein